MTEFDDDKLYSDKNHFSQSRNDLIHAIKGNKLKRADDGIWEEVQDNVEYYSPEQHGIYHGVVYRQYFGPVLPTDLLTGNNVSALVDYELCAKDETDRHIGHGMHIDGADILQIHLTGVVGKGNLVLEAAGIFLGNVVHGWVDYTK